MHMCKETCIHVYVTRVFFYMFMVQNYKHTNLLIFSKIACVYRGQHTHGTRILRLSCSWCVPYVPHNRVDLLLRCCPKFATKLAILYHVYIHLVTIADLLTTQISLNLQYFIPTLAGNKWK